MPEDAPLTLREAAALLRTSLECALRSSPPDVLAVDADEDHCRLVCRVRSYRGAEWWLRPLLDRGRYRGWPVLLRKEPA